MLSKSSRWFFGPKAGFSASRACSKGRAGDRGAETRRKIKPNKAASASVQFSIAAIGPHGVMGLGESQRAAEEDAWIPQLRGEYRRRVCAVQHQRPVLFVPWKGVRRSFEGSAGKAFEASANPRQGSCAPVERAPDHGPAYTRRQRGASPGQLLRTRRRPRSRRAGIDLVQATDQPLTDGAPVRSGRWSLSTTTSADDSCAAPASTSCTTPTRYWPRAGAVGAVRVFVIDQLLAAYARGWRLPSARHRPAAGRVCAPPAPTRCRP